MIFNGERTIYNIKFQNSKMFGLDYKPLNNTTLNEKFNILPRHRFPETEPMPVSTLNLIVIGVTDTEQNKDNTRYNLKTSRHSPIDGALFNHVPFYCRKESEVEKFPPNPNLRLKKRLYINGEYYLAYYGYKFEEILYKEDIIEFREVEKEYTNISKYSTSKSQVLNPEPIKDLRMEMQVSNYIGDFVKIYMFLTYSDILEIKHAIEVTNPEIVNKNITEIGVCHSVEVKQEDGSYENVWTQISYFIDCLLDIEEGLKKKELSFYLEIGGMEILNIKD